MHTEFHRANNTDALNYHGAGSVNLMDQVRTHRLIPVLEIASATNALPLAEAILEGGISIMEITLRTPDAIKAITAIRSTFPEILVGAGTVISLEQAAIVQDVGAQFGVSPGFDSEVVKSFQDQGIPFIPGVVTPSEVQAAIKKQCSLLKFFPADAAGGPQYLSRLSGVFSAYDIQFCATGGVNQENMSDYFKIPSVCSIGGSWLASRQQIHNQDWRGIKRQVALALELILPIRES